MAEWIARQGVEGCDGWAVVSDAVTEPAEADVESCHETELDAVKHIVELERAGTEAPDSEDETEDEPVVEGGPAPALAADEPVMDVPAGTGDPTTGTPWRGVLAMANSRTQDGRIYASLGVRDDLPTMPFALQERAQHAGFDPEGAIVCGTIERTQVIGNAVLGWGLLDTSEAGRRGVELMENAGRFGVSVDLADMDADVTWVCLAEGEPEIDPFFGEEYTPCADSVMIFPFSRVGGASMTPIAAFEQAWVELATASDLDDDAWAEAAASEAQASLDERDAERLARMESRGHTIVAAAIPAVPQRAWFEVPESDAPTPLTVTSDGQVYGHLGLWGECHIGLPGCTSPPRSASGYAYFHTGEIDVDGPEGRERISVGNLTFRSSHADTHMLTRAAVRHYEDTALVAADLVVHDGTLGIWCAGALRPGLDEATLREIMASKPSGDWRGIGGGRELVAVHNVNTPGFMGPHGIAKALVAGAGAGAQRGQVKTLLRVAYGYETPGATLANRGQPTSGGVSKRAFARLQHEMTELRATVELLWEHGGRDARMAHLADVVERGTPLVRRPALVAAAALPDAVQLVHAAGESCSCGGTCGHCSS
jgi:hypothetical protein